MDWNYLWHQFLTIVLQPVFLAFLTALAAFIKSEKMALDNTTQASGIVHWFKLANKAMQIVPESVITAAEIKADALVPGAGQIVEALTKEDANEISDTPAPGV